MHGDLCYFSILLTRLFPENNVTIPVNGYLVLSPVCSAMRSHNTSPTWCLDDCPTFWMTCLILIGLFSILGCTDPVPDHTLRFGLANAPTNLDPRYATDATSARINRLIYSRLVDFGEGTIPIPALATWSEMSPIHYRFELREPRPAFHNGGQLSANDVKATYESILNPKTASPHRGVLQIVARIETPTNSTVDFFLAHPDSFFPGYLIIGILPANLITNGHPFHDRPLGSGPFQFLERPDETRLVISNGRITSESNF